MRQSRPLRKRHRDFRLILGNAILAAGAFSTTLNLRAAAMLSITIALMLLRAGPWLVMVKVWYDVFEHW